MLPVIAGNPPADAAQPFGINGIIVAVIMNVTLEPRAPRIPDFYSRILKTRACQTPFRNPQKPTGLPDAENRVHPKNERAVADIRNQYLRLVLKPFLIPKKQEYDYH